MIHLANCGDFAKMSKETFPDRIAWVREHELEILMYARDPEGTYLTEDGLGGWSKADSRSEEHTSELQSLMRISYAVFCLKKKKGQTQKTETTTTTKRTYMSENDTYTNTINTYKS